MTIQPFNASMLLALLPEISLLVLAGGVLALDLIWRAPRRGRWLGWVTAAGLTVILVEALLLSRPAEEPALILGGMLRHDWPAFSFRILFLFAAIMTSLLSLSMPKITDHGEYFALLLISVLGMSLMASSADLMMLFLAIETTSIPLYILAGFIKGDLKSTESGLKYFLFGALTSAVMLYGFSLLYGLTGETNLYAVTTALQAGAYSYWVVLGICILILVGFMFKVSAAPFHFWAPDVYEGAPTPITAFISTASKAAGFVVLVRVLLATFPSVESYWTLILAMVSTATMTIGNLLAIPQQNMKRLLAYSSIAHAGYALIGLVALSTFGTASLVFYLAGYIVTNLAAFAVVIAFSYSTGSEEIADYAGLSRRSPVLGLALMVAFLSLAGMPPLVGFVAKFYVFAAAVQSGWIWLAFVGVLNAIVGLYYYMTVLKVVYLYRSEDDHLPIAVPLGTAVALGVCILAIVLIGVVSGPWLDWAVSAALALF